ncbi:MAG: sugar ABC transporter permease [Devosiaceae bacterium]|nr:sugar ABC transporter permease [Devosiaceae bacterium]
MFEQVAGAAFTVLIGVAAALAYFWGSNWLLDKFLLTGDDVPGPKAVRRDKTRSSIRPWLFLAPALLFLSTYLVYPVFATIWYSMLDSNAQNFVGFSNYTWAFNNPDFLQSLYNNFLWLLIVPAASTALGLLIAVISDRLWWGNIAKSLIFMPMAISFVGASVIWKFVYDYRGVGAEQIGIINAIVQALGFEAQAWISVSGLNSILLMIILIWIEVGFAMVILSAALRGVSEETLEAAKIDGANEFQIFFSIMIPQIMPTIIVVWTTITIKVLKVFDIILAMTNGQWDTQVLANMMFDWMFRGNDFGRSSTIAIVIMLAVMPIMIWNIRQANKEEGTR